MARRLFLPILKYALLTIICFISILEKKSQKDKMNFHRAPYDAFVAHKFILKKGFKPKRIYLVLEKVNIHKGEPEPNIFPKM